MQLFPESIDHLDEFVAFRITPAEKMNWFGAIASNMRKSFGSVLIRVRAMTRRAVIE
jgi:hypothetical protein